MRRSDFDPVYLENQKKQIRIFIYVVLAVFFILITRLWYLQIFCGNEYRIKSEKNMIRSMRVAPLRGMICDRNGEILVTNCPAYDLKVIPEDIQDMDLLLKKLSSLIKIHPEEIRHRLIKALRNRPFKPFCLKRDISRDEVARIESHEFNLPGLMITVAPKRRYIYGDLAAHLLGYLGEITEKEIRSGKFPANQPGDLVGKSGVEEKWNMELTGIPGAKQVEVDALGRKIRTISYTPPIPGANITLTIDRRLQSLAQQLLKGKKGAIVALDPHNGEVLAMASSPTFDPNAFVEGIDRKLWKHMMTSGDFPLQNRALSGQYPPASVFKIVVAIAALSDGIITPETEEFCSGVYTLGNRNFHCWKKYGHGKLDLHDALVQSCDIYFYKVGKNLGIDRISHYAKQFGFGNITGFDVGREQPGLVPTREWKLRRFGVPWQQGETLGLAIGQSFMLVTPIQMAAFISSVFNGGILFTPHATKKISFPYPTKNEGLKLPAGKALKLNIKEETLDVIKRALIGVVNEPNGTGKRAAIEGVLVAGKTGTAQVITKEHEKKQKQGRKKPHYRFVDHAWFVCVAPADNPRIALSIIIEHGGHGGSAAAPIARELIRSYLEETGFLHQAQANAH